MGLNSKIPNDTSPQAEKILAVDDSSLVIDLIKFALRKFPFQVISVTRPEAGLALLAQENISFIITDIKMPDMSGVDFLMRLRRMPAHKTTPVLVMSGYEEQEYVDAAFAAGATAFIGKPFTSDKLLDCVMHEMQIKPKDRPQA